MSSPLLATTVLHHLIDFVAAHREELLTGRVERTSARHVPVALTVGAVSLTIDVTDEGKPHADLRVLLDRHADLGLRLALDEPPRLRDETPRLDALVEDFAVRDHEHIVPRPRFEIAFYLPAAGVHERARVPSSERVLELVALAVSLERALADQPRAALTFSRQACSSGSV